MKKALVAVLAVVMVLGVTTFAGPFISGNLGLAQTPSYTVDLTAGYKAESFSASFTANNVLSSTHTLDFDIAVEAGHSWWAVDAAFSINDITLSADPIGEIGTDWLGTLHVGSLLVSDEGLSPFVLDFYGGLNVKYSFIAPVGWMPTGKIGFYWEFK